MKETLKTLFLSEWSPLEKGLLMADALLFGVVIGWLTAPLRHGFSLFSGNTSGSGSNFGSEGEEEDMDEEIDEEEEEDEK